MAEKVFIVTGLGWGDEGKGSVTNWLCHKNKVHTVVRTGGPQALHHVATARGQSNVFSQFGSGTFYGSATHLSKNMVVDPIGIVNEGEILRYEFGLNWVFETLTMHEDALVVTPYHVIVNRLREIARGKNRYGSVGMGVGETVLDAELPDSEPIRAGDLQRSDLTDKLEAVRQRKVRKLKKVFDAISTLSKKDGAKAKAEIMIANLKNPFTSQWTVAKFRDMARRVKIVGDDYFAKKIIGRPGVVVFEGSQGVMLDRWHGFHPYVTKVRTVPDTALSLLREIGYDGKITSLGVLRAYHTRHGAGPFVTESLALTKKLPDETNNSHPWQGNFRVGCFDALAARYALEVSGGYIGLLDGIVLTCADRVVNLGRWEVCERYEKRKETGDDNFFSRDSSGFIDNIFVREGHDAKQLKRQEELGRRLGHACPRTIKFKIPLGKNKKVLADLLARALKSFLRVPILAISLGPTEKDKIEL